LDEWFGATRHTYNQVVDLSRTRPVSDDLTVKALRSKFMGSDTPEWAQKVPYDVRDNAIRDFDKARKAQLAKIKLAKQAGEQLTGFQFRFKSKKDRQCLTIRGRDWGRKRGVYTQLFTKEALKASEDLPSVMTADFRVIKTQLGHYFVCLPRVVEPKSESQAPTAHHATVALDPGVRTFQTCYDADGNVFEWGAGDMDRLFQLCYAADRLQGRFSSSKGTKRKRRKRAWLRLLERIRHKVDEIHKKLATWLCENYRVVLLPVFETQRMVRRRNRKLGSKTARGMCAWSHFRFRQRLKQKAELYPWCTIVECDEAYTSKTCGGCGRLHGSLGSNKTFRCPSCFYEADRDASASRNILLRYLTRNRIGF
jgi:putative transposase